MGASKSISLETAQPVVQDWLYSDVIFKILLSLQNHLHYDVTHLTPAQTFIH